MSSKVTHKEVAKELAEHPWLSVDQARRMVADHHNRPKTTTKEGKKEYQKRLMRINRAAKKLPANMNSKDFSVVWQAILGDDKTKPKMKYQNPDKW